MANSDVFFDALIKRIKDEINTAVFGRVNAYNASNKTASITPVGGLLNGMPLVGVPILTFKTGDYTIESDVKSGDVVLVIFLDDDSENLFIDGTEEVNTDRRHSFNDAVAIPFTFGYFNQSQSAAQGLAIKDDKNNQSIVLKSNGGIEITSSADVIIKTDKGELSVNTLIP